MYKYFVSYIYESNGCRGFGYSEVPWESKITDFNTINLIKKAIEESCNIKKVVILNYQLMSKPNQKGT